MGETTQDASNVQQQHGECCEQIECLLSDPHNTYSVLHVLDVAGLLDARAVQRALVERMIERLELLQTDLGVVLNELARAMDGEGSADRIRDIVHSDALRDSTAEAIEVMRFEPTLGNVLHVEARQSFIRRWMHAWDGQEPSVVDEAQEQKAERLDYEKVMGSVLRKAGVAEILCERLRGARHG